MERILTLSNPSVAAGLLMIYAKDSGYLVESEFVNGANTVEVSDGIYRVIKARFTKGSDHVVVIYFPGIFRPVSCERLLRDLGREVPFGIGYRERLRKARSIDP